MMNNTPEELAALIAEFRDRFPDLGVEAIDAEPLTSVIDESLPADDDDDSDLPAEIKTLIEAAAKELASRIMAGESLPLPGMIKLSALDDSPESMEAMQAVRNHATTHGTTMQALQPTCYHYILDEHGNPVHCEDRQRVRRFIRRKRHIVKETILHHGKMTVQIVTTLVIHNPAPADEVPPPQWMTSIISANTGKVGFQCATTKRRDVLRMHRDVVMHAKQAIADCRVRPSSPRRRAVAQRRIAAGQSVLGKRGAQ